MTEDQIRAIVREEIKRGKDEAAQKEMQSLRLHGTEIHLREEFALKPDVTQAAIEARRKELHAEFDRRVMAVTTNHAKRCR